MTLDNLKKHYARLKWLVSGEFTERDFDYKINATENPNGKDQGEAGRMTQGEFINKAGAKRKDLIIFKAKRALKIFEGKYPEFVEVEKPVEEVKEVEEKKPKPKEKK